MESVLGQAQKAPSHEHRCPRTGEDGCPSSHRERKPAFPLLLSLPGLTRGVTPTCLGEGGRLSQSTNGKAPFAQDTLPAVLRSVCQLSRHPPPEPVQSTQKINLRKVGSSLASLLPPPTRTVSPQHTAQGSFYNEGQVTPLLCPELSSGLPKPSEYKPKF